MSYRYARIGASVSDEQWRLSGVVCALIAVSVAVAVPGVLGHHVLPPWLAAFGLVGALGVATASSMRNKPVAEVYFPRSDGRWISPDGRRVVEPSHLADDPRASLTESFSGGFAAGTVCRVRRTTLNVAGRPLHEVTLAVAAPAASLFQTRLLMVVRPDDRSLFGVGEVLPLMRFSTAHPDVALAPDDVREQICVAGVIALDEALAVAVGVREGSVAPVWDSRTYRRLTRFGSVYPALKYERPDLVFADVARRRRKVLK
ncbi:MAG: hypothetical protein QM658_02000 [Gordonia sp. (in: high G+C Gram-positive bacteria)]